MPELFIILVLSIAAGAERFFAERRYVEERYRLLAIITAAKVSDGTAAAVARLPFTHEFRDTTTEPRPIQAM